jgi:cell division protein FtsB
MPKKIFRFFIPKILVIASLVLIFWIVNATIKEMNRGKRIQEEIALLNEEAQTTQKENTRLRENIQYLQTDAFSEQEARNKLNYQSSNEKVVVIKPSVVSEDKQEQEAQPVALAVRDSVPNYEKWWHQFFVF